jgi:hypothetical protein
MLPAYKLVTIESVMPVTQAADVEVHRAFGFQALAFLWPLLWPLDIQGRHQYL